MPAQTYRVVGDVDGKPKKVIVSGLTLQDAERIRDERNANRHPNWTYRVTYDLIQCGACFGWHQMDQSCGCFDNGSQ